VFMHISFWCLGIPNFYFQNANGPSAEAILLFYDLVILLILPIAFGVIVFLSSLFLKVPSFRLLVESQEIEFLWTLIPIISLVALSIPSLSLLYLLDEAGFPSSTTVVQGNQWYWVYSGSDLEAFSSESYLASGPCRLLSTSNSLSVSSRLVLRFLITAADVLHS